MLIITPNLSIPEGELQFNFSRSSGPGGQNVNKVSTRVTLLFNLTTSPSLSVEQRRLIREKLATRINKDGVLRVVSQKHRTQSANRRAVREKFILLLQQSLRPRPVRKKKPVPRSVIERRLENKKHRGRLKESRTRAWEERD
ncbi:MAG: aminoacyl-tRNA hydrolase [Candidatus Krumholzibacteriota bacterium]|nr:aminoacyl-tRNA hydrolase [Candidatus Krumholzibacteriota bacterium]